MYLRTGALALLMLAAGCGPAAEDPTANALVEAEALNDAGSMLVNDRQDAVVVTNADEGAGNVE